ncbi:hypothetical protein BKA65DRAFT_565785 [Rhexocercosporidium sp. MPI-PUGE-AT-0058]|nr:hypothetical protein BKA65DRAFT_565785 [Rhexocercosporidium sp. MPI-PUGE-AT-0058]
MANFRPNGFNRDMSCRYTESRDGGDSVDVLEGLPRKLTEPSTTSRPQLITPSLSPNSQTTILLAPIQSTLSTLYISIIQSPSSSPSQPSAKPESSSILLSATIPLQLLGPSITSPSFQTSSPDSISSSDNGTSELDSFSTSPFSGGIRSQAGGILAGVIGGVILLALLITLFFCRRSRRKQHRQSLGYTSSARKYRPWKKKEVERRNVIANSEGPLDDDDGGGHRKPDTTNDKTIQIPIFSYAGKGNGSNSPPLKIPEPAFVSSFAPLRAYRSSSVYSGSLYDSLATEHFPPRARSALLPPPPAGITEANVYGGIANPFMTPSELLKQVGVRDGGFAAKPLPRSGIYIARPYSMFDIAYDHDEKDRERDSGISGVSNGNRNNFRHLSSSSSSTSIASETSNYSTARSDSLLRLSQISTDATSITKVQRALVSVRDLDTDVQLSLNNGQYYRYKTGPFEITQVVDLATRRRMKREMEESKLITEVDGGVKTGGGLEPWEEREIKRRMRGIQKARLYTGRIRPGMGVQKRGGGTLGVQRNPWEGEVRVPRKWPR